MEPSAKFVRSLSGAAVWFALIVIVWGAFVRMSGSGDGCGVHWPLCHGEILPLEREGKTWIEYIHRALSGIFGIVILAVFFLARKQFVPRSPERIAASIALISTIVEALVGAKLVLWELVGSDQSMRRVIVSGFHLCNTFILLASLTALSNEALSKSSLKKRKILWLVVIGAILFVCTSVLGSWASLSKTLFPASSLASGLAADFSPASHFVVRYRILHPIFATVLATYLLVLAAISPKGRGLVAAFPYLLVSTFVIGGVTLIYLSPIWLSLSHLILVNLVWIAFIQLSIAIGTASR